MIEALSFSHSGLWLCSDCVISLLSSDGDRNLFLLAHVVHSD